MLMTISYILLCIPEDEVWFGNLLRSVPRFQVYNVSLRPALKRGTGWQSGLGSQSYLNIFRTFKKERNRSKEILLF